jgi:hypothetical protein
MYPLLPILLTTGHRLDPDVAPAGAGGLSGAG